MLDFVVVNYLLLMDYVERIYYDYVDKNENMVFLFSVDVEKSSFVTWVVKSIYMS